MSHRISIDYLVSVLVVWMPLTFAVRRTWPASLAKTLVGGVLMAATWPFAMPVLSSIWMSRRQRLATIDATPRSRTSGAPRDVISSRYDPGPSRTELPQDREVRPWPGLAGAKPAAH